MSPKTPKRRTSGSMKLRKLDPTGRHDSTRGRTPSSAPDAPAESSERSRGGRHDGALIKFAAAPVDTTVLPRFSAGSNQHFDDIVDLSAFPSDLQSRLTSGAPFLLGLKDVVYDKHFYNQVAGLCASGPHPNEVTEDMMPRSKWALKWGGAEGVADSASRIWLKDAETDATREQYESLYARVYGNKPDNGALANFFLRTATYYFEENEPVDWAAQALEIHEKRFSNPTLNPQKLMPPCLTKQVQRMVDEFANFLANPHGPASPQVKNLGPSYLDAYKLRVESALEEEATCIDQILRLKNELAMLELSLTTANKGLQHHNIDLELLFKSKHNAEASGDTHFVKYAFDQIQAIAKTITDAVETVKNFEEQIKASKANVELAETEMLPHLRSVLRDRKCQLLDAISEVGVFPQHILPKLPERGAMETLCPYCSRVYVSNAFVPLSCGCRYHPPCMRALIFTGQMNCLACGARPHGTWMAYWGFPLDPEMSSQVEEHRARSMREEDWVEAAPDKVGSVVPFGPELSNSARALAVIPYPTNVVDMSSPSL